MPNPTDDLGDLLADVDLWIAAVEADPELICEPRTMQHLRALRAEAKSLQAVAAAHEDVLAAYRVGGRPKGKSLDVIHAWKERNRG